MPRGTGYLRVIGGAMRGRRIETLPGKSIRPTGDRVREALFDILGPKVKGAAFLDIYSGTGAIGIEALSRGASDVTFIESDAAAGDLVRRNLALSGAEPAHARVIVQDPARAIALLQREERRFNFVYLDPPYEGGELARGLLLIGESNLLSHDAIVIAEHDARTQPLSNSRLSAYRTARYGRTALTFYAAGDSDPSR